MKNQKDEDLKILREWIWNDREEVIDALLLHTCAVRERTAAMVRLVGWAADDFVLAALRGRRDELS